MTHNCFGCLHLCYFPPGYLAEEEGMTKITLFVPGMFFGCLPMSNFAFFSSPKKMRKNPLITLVSGKGTRPDTGPPVADGWAGAEMRVIPLFNWSVTDQPTD